jgi:hypothetical protein
VLPSTQLSGGQATVALIDVATGTGMVLFTARFLAQ